MRFIGMALGLMMGAFGSLVGLYLVYWFLYAGWK